MPQGLNANLQNYQSEVWSSIGAGLGVWVRPRGHTMAMIFALGGGGSGGVGVIGTNSNAAAGGGGASGNQCRLIIPLYLTAPILYVNTPGPAINSNGGTASVSIEPDSVVNHQVLIAAGGGIGGDASGLTPGNGGSVVSTANLASCPLAGLGVAQFRNAQSGTAGGDGVTAPADLILPTNSLVVTGGCGGGGLPAAGLASTIGASLVVPPAPSQFPPASGGASSATATNPAAPGAHGYSFIAAGLGYFYGGCGSASTHGTATGGGLVQGRGGDGGIGCGGGASGGALTGSVASVRSLGGAAAVWIISW